MPNFLDTVLGLGYSGYAFIDGVPLLLTSSPLPESENLYKSKGAVGSLMGNSAGEMVVSQRRSIEFSLSSDLTHALASLIAPSMFTWRNSFATYGNFHRIIVSAANGEGYDSPEAYIDEITVTVPNEGMCTITFHVKAFRWAITPGTTTPRFHIAWTPTGDAENQPIPFWNTRIVHTGVSGTTRRFTVVFRNQWQFKTLLEGTFSPPTPRLVFAGPLAIGLEQVTIAEPNTPPADSGRVTITLGGNPMGPLTPPAWGVTIPLMYRDPQRTYENPGNRADLVNWTVSWAALGLTPALS